MGGSCRPVGAPADWGCGQSRMPRAALMRQQQLASTHFAGSLAAPTGSPLCLRLLQVLVQNLAELGHLATLATLLQEMLAAGDA